MSTLTAPLGVNVLGAGQSAVALAFARKGGPEKFNGISWEFHDDPLLMGRGTHSGHSPLERRRLE